MSQTCLVIGGAGFIGSHIAYALLENGYRVKIFDQLCNMANPFPIHKVEIIQGDYYNCKEWELILKNVDFIFHNISTTIPFTSNQDLIYDIETNVLGNIRFLNEVIKHPIKKFVFSSSGGTIYGNPKVLPIAESAPNNPISSYAITKLIIEKYLNYYNYHYGLDYASLRYSNVYGIGQNPKGMLGAITVFLTSLVKGEPITVFGDGNTIRDYVYIDDIVRANLLVAEGKASEHIFNVGTGVGVSINELIGSIEQVTGIKCKVNYAMARECDVIANILDRSLIKNEFGWEPKTTLKEGIYILWKHLSSIQ